MAVDMATDTTAVKLEALHRLTVPPEISFERGAAAPADDSTSSRLPGTDNDVHPSVRVWIARRLCLVPDWILPDDHGLIQGVEPRSCVSILPLPRQRGLSSLGILRAECQGMGYELVLFQAHDKLFDKVVCCLGIWMTEDYIHIAACFFPSSVPADDDHLEALASTVCPLQNGLCNGFHLCSRYFLEEFFIVLDPDLLHPR